ncbi:ribose-phosphate diphosphokinase [Bradyrhizobium sp. NBAIM20]
MQGFFDISVDNIYASPVLLSDLKSRNYTDLVVVSPDVGGVVRARALAKQLGCDLAIIDKRRPAANVSEVMHVIGEIDGRNCVIMDDMVDTAGTLVVYDKLDNTQTGSALVAQDKAVSAALFKRPTKAFQDVVASGPAGARVLSLRGANAVEGGLPIVVDGKIIGAIGVSGGTSDQDGVVAKAGLDALAPK